MNFKIFAAALLLPCAGNAVASGHGAAVRADYNVVIILMETLRPDHLGCYDYPVKTSPNIDKLAAESAVFENAFAQSSQSLISAASLLTGLYPPSNGIVGVGARLAEDIPTIAGEFQRRGYKTAAYTAGFFLNRGFGLDSGFDTYDDSKDFGTLADVLPGAVQWLRSNKKEKFLLLVHGYDAHAPYRAPKEFLAKFRGGYTGQLAGVPLDYHLADRVWQDGIYEDFRLKKKVAKLAKADVDYIVSQYDGAVLYADAQVGKLLAELETQGLTKKTLVLFMASAGEALMDRGSIISSFHGGLYEEGLRVPLIIRVPGASACRIKGGVQLVDVMPTVLELAGVPALPALQGGSLTACVLAGKEPQPRTVYAQTYAQTGSPAVGIRKYPWKLVLTGGQYELFNLAADPAERNNIAAARPEELKAMRAELERLLAAMPRRASDSGQQPLAKVRERMKALGYWWLDRPRWTEGNKTQEKGDLPASGRPVMP